MHYFVKQKSIKAIIVLLIIVNKKIMQVQSVVMQRHSVKYLFKSSKCKTLNLFLWSMYVMCRQVQNPLNTFWYL